MKSSLFSLLFLALSPALFAHAEPAPQRCFRYEGQSIQDAAADAIFNGTLDQHTSDLECLKALVAQGLDLKDPSGSWGSGRSPVSLAAHAGAPEILEYILSQGLSIGDMNDPIEAKNLAEISAVGGSAKVVQMLQARGMPLFVKNPAWPRSYMKPSNYFLDTCSLPLMEATLYLRTELVKYLVTQGAKVNSRCSTEHPIYGDEGYPTALIVLANSHNAFDSINGDVKGRRVIANQLLKFLIDAGGDLNAREDIRGNTAAQLLLSSNWISAEMKAYVRAHLAK